MRKMPLKKGHYFALPVLLFMIPLTFTFSPSNSENSVKAIALTSETKVDEAAETTALYNNLGLKAKGLSEVAFQKAMEGFNKLTDNKEIRNKRLLTIADFTKSSTQKRLFVIDVENEKILFNTYVAHGRGSGGEYADKLSNVPESFQSSPGFYETSGTYIGKNGYSLKLEGLEKGINSNAMNRAIVIHGAPYVSEGFINTKGFLGRSHGCPALPEKLNKPIIETIKNGSCLFIYSDKNNYLGRSTVLNG